MLVATENQEKMFRKAQRVRRLVVDELNKIYENYDIIIAPNGGGVAPLIDEAAEDYLSDEYIILENWLCLANFAGTPEGVEPLAFPYVVETTFLREDEPNHVISTEDALKNCKTVQRNQIRVPKVVG